MNRNDSLQIKLEVVDLKEFEKKVIDKRRSIKLAEKNLRKVLWNVVNGKNGEC